MAGHQTAIAAANEPPIFTWQSLLDQIKAPLEHRFSEGPWNGRHLPPMTHRAETFLIEAIGPRVREIDTIAYMSSVDHLHRALEWGFPNPDVIAADPDFTHLDMWGEWVNMGRGDAFTYVALTHERDRELGAAYFRPTEDGDDPHETGLMIWVIEEMLRDDFDIVLLKEVLAWIEADWDFDRVIHYTPEAYQRGLEVAAAAGLRRVDRKGPGHSQGGTELTNRPSYAAFEWVRP